MELGGKTLYHGTVHEFTEIDLSKCDNKFRDFGRGFYLTSEFQQAQSWAAHKSELSASKARVYRYKLDEEIPDHLKLYEFLEYDEKWLQCIVDNRRHGTSIVDDGDIVYDRMADSFSGQITAAIKKYEKAVFDASQTIEVLRKGRKKRDQFCFKTVGAVSLLQPQGYYIIGEGWHE